MSILDRLKNNWMTPVDAPPEPVQETNLFFAVYGEQDPEMIRRDSVSVTFYEDAAAYDAACGRQLTDAQAEGVRVAAALAAGGH